MALNIAHRGGAGLWPENTLNAFARAAAMGADGAELDVQLTRDNEVVVFHDNRLKADLCRDADGIWLDRTGPRIVDLSFEFRVVRTSLRSRGARPSLSSCLSN
jgi:glycerophosphoryl diester phosphodiesterase